MNEPILFLVITYMALAVLLLGLHIYSAVPMWVKVVLTLTVGGFFFVTHNALYGMLGWPTKRELPEEFLMLASRVVEPDKAGKTKGDIYIWVASIDDSYPNRRPRAYRVEYSEELHVKLEKADRQMRRGIVQMGRIEKIDALNKITDTQQTYKQIEQIVIFDVPDPQLPEK